MLKRLLTATALLLATLSSLPATAQQGPSSTTIIQPCRLYDSRDFQPGPLTNGVTYQLKARGSCGIPEDANGILFTVASVDASSSGWITVWASDLLLPLSPTVHFDGSGVDSSAGWSRLCAPPILECSDVDLSFRIAFTPSHVILDVVGWTQLLE